MPITRWRENACANESRFPGLARNTPELRHKAEEYQAGEITREEYDYVDTLKRSELSNMAFYIQSIGEIVILAIIVGIMFGIDVNASTENNNWVRKFSLKKIVIAEQRQGYRGAFSHNMGFKYSGNTAQISRNYAD